VKQGDEKVLGNERTAAQGGLSESSDFFCKQALVPCAENISKRADTAQRAVSVN